jgi:hypothetical protein
MLTTDFTGTYDYEMTEARMSADYILEDLASGYMTQKELPARVERERNHWKHVLDTAESFDDWNTHFTKFMRIGTGVAV